ncbi:MAG: decarboxylating 6-phosphogluconate dehydrogenase [Woeseiaceae bacterium]|nr:decarboxylating 6-phosphogluconate dehydrogenase [Woeseiaceae bacterium]
MKIGMIGLGKMGGNMARRLRAAGIDVVGFSRDIAEAQALAEDCGLIVAESTEHLVEQLSAPRVVWLMLPAGEVTEATVDQLSGLLDKGDMIVDGANSNYKDSLRRGEALSAAGIHFVDAGVSGGVWGLENGYTLMVGGEDDALDRLRPALEALAPAADRGWLHTGSVGSGHYTKMVHNGIEYGMMQAYAEGFSLLEASDDFELNVADIAEVWRHGSVIRSWLLDLTQQVLAGNDDLSGIEPVVADSGEGRWTSIAGIELGVPTPVITAALMARFASQGQQDFAARLLAMMRNQFGGHAVAKSD